MQCSCSDWYWLLIMTERIWILFSPSDIILWGRAAQADKIFNSGFLNLLITLISPRPMVVKKNILFRLTSNSDVGHSPVQCSIFSLSKYKNWYLILQNTPGKYNSVKVKSWSEIINRRTENVNPFPEGGEKRREPTTSIMTSQSDP